MTQIYREVRFILIYKLNAYDKTKTKTQRAAKGKLLDFIFIRDFVLYCNLFHTYFPIKIFQIKRANIITEFVAPL